MVDEVTDMNNWTSDSPFVNWTTESPQPHPVPHYSLAVGFIAVAAASILFGSNLLPVKKFNMGDGVFYLWIYCASIWMVGFVINIIKRFPAFRPLAMLGGFLWCTGAVLTVPIIKTVGLSQGMLIWASVNLLAGWASDRFGWFGLTARMPNSNALNISGVCLCLVSACVYMFLKTTTSHPPSNPSSPETESLHANHSTPIDAETESDPVFYEKFRPVAKRAFGTVLAVISGILFGFNFVPVIYIQDKCIGASPDGLDYVFAHFSGIFATSFVFMLLYSAVMRNLPRVYPRVILPGVVSGVMWGVADICWFIANDALFPAVSFPIIATFPAIIGAMWGMFMFGEIRGKKNYIILSVAIFFAVSGALLTGLSKSEIAGKAAAPEHHDKWNCTRL